MMIIFTLALTTVWADYSALPKNDNTPQSNTKWADPAPIPSCYLTTPSPQATRSHLANNVPRESPQSNTKWADPAPIPSCYLTSSPRNASSHLAHHQQPHNTSSPNPNLPSLPLLSPTYPNSFQCPPYFHDLTLRLSPQPRPFDDLNATTLTPPPHPYPNHQLTTLHNMCDRYPHINYSYLFMQCAPLSHVLSHTPKP